MSTTRIEIYTDGACRGNPGPGGWAAILRYGAHEKELAGADLQTTNNRMELMAAIEALRALKRPSTVDLTTDSQYLRLGITEWIHNWQKQNWKTSNKKPVKNSDLWMDLLNVIQPHQITWHWVKGHSGHQENERVDVLANQAIDKLLASQPVELLAADSA